MKTASGSKAPGFFLFCADIGIKASKEESKQRSRERGVGIQEEGESVVELLDLSRETHFLRGGICHEDASRPARSAGCNRTSLLSVFIV